MASGCICGRQFMQEANGGTCLVCGHGVPDTPICMEVSQAAVPRLARLPRDLGALQRLGRRIPSGRFMNCR